MEGETIVYIVLTGIIGSIAFLVFVFSWFALTVDKNEKSKQS